MSAPAAARGYRDGRSARSLRRRGLVLLLEGAAILVLVRPLGRLDHVWFLGTTGFAVSAASVAAPAVFLGLGAYLSSTYPGLLITFWIAGLALLWGTVELGNATRAHRAGTSP